MSKLISELPQEIQDLVFERQQEQCNISDPNMRLDNCYSDGNFNWDDAPEGMDFWESIDDGNYKPFYDLYPLSHSTWDVIVEVFNQSELNKLFEFAKGHNKLSYFDGTPTFNKIDNCFRLDKSGGHASRNFYGGSPRYINYPIITFNEFFNSLSINEDEEQVKIDVTLDGDTREEGGKEVKFRTLSSRNICQRGFIGHLLK